MLQRVPANDQVGGQVGVFLGVVIRDQRDRLVGPDGLAEHRIEPDRAAAADLVDQRVNSPSRQPISSAVLPGRR